MNLMLMMIAAAPINLPHDGAIRWEIETAKPIQSIGCENSFSYGDGDHEIHRRLAIQVSHEGGKLDEVELATPDCLQYLSAAEQRTDVPRSSSIATLAALANGASLSRKSSELLSAAIAWHGGNEALQELRGLSQLAQDSQWKPAVFWLAQLGAPGIRSVVEFLDAGHSVEHRKHALIVLALQDDPQVLEPVRQSAELDPEAEVRAEALFALAIADAPGAASFIETIARNDAAGIVRQRAIFALSQVDNAAAVDALIRIVKDTDFGDHRREALFWLAQMDQDRASELVAKMASSL